VQNFFVVRLANASGLILGMSGDAPAAFAVAVCNTVD